MNIVLVIDAYDVHSNGTSISAQRFCTEFKKRGHNVRVVCAGDGHGEYDVGTFKIPFFQDIIDKQGTAIAKPGKKIMPKALEGADIVHIYQAFPLGQEALKCAKKMDIPVISAFHMHPENVMYSLHLERFPGVEKGLYKLLNRWLYSHTTHIHCPSDFIAAQLKSQGYNNNLHIISNGVSDSFCPGKAEKPDKYKNKFVILSVGRLAREKRHDILLNAVAQSQYKDKIQIIIAGTGPEESSLKRLAKKLDIAVKFDYFTQGQLVHLMHFSDLYVHCADIEIEGIACIEALSCAIAPVISDSPNSAAAQFAINDENIFTHGSPESLAAKINYWIKHDDERIQSGAQHAFYVSNKYGLNASIDSILKVYESAIRDHKKGPEPDAHVVKNWTPLNMKITAKTKIINFTLPFLLISKLFRMLAIPLLFIIDRAFWGLKIKGVRNLKLLKRRGAITVANHVHSMDATFVSLGTFPRNMNFSSIKGNFEIPLVRWIVRILGGFPIPETTAGLMRFTKDIGRALQKGRLIHFYPEAALWPYHKKLRPFKNGAFRYAVQFDVPVLPSVIVFKERKLRKPAARLIILEPIEPPDKSLGSIKKRTDYLRDITYKSMNSVINDWYELEQVSQKNASGQLLNS